MKKILTIWFCMLACTVIMACTNGSHISQESNDENKVNNWKENGFRVDNTVKIQQEIWPSSYDEWLANNNDYELLCVLGVQGECIYRVWGKNTDSTNYVCLERYNFNKGEQDFFDLKEMIPEDSYFVDAQILGMNRLAIRVNQIQTGDNAGISKIIVTNYENILSEINEEEIKSISGDANLLLSDYYIDTQNNIFYSGAIEGESVNSFYVINKDTDLHISYKGKETEVGSSFFHDEEDNVFFSIYDTADCSMDIIWYDPRKNRFINLVTIEEDCPIQIFGKYGDNIFYRSIEGIVRWNIHTGDRINISPMTFDGYMEYLTLDKNENIAACIYKSVQNAYDGWVVHFSGEPVDRGDNTIQIVNLTNFDRYVKDAAIITSQNVPQYLYAYEKYSGVQLQDAKTRIFVDMINGDGPDILYLSYEDFMVLGQKGLLAEIGTILSEKDISSILPGALELGTVDKKIMGIPCGLSLSTGITLKSIWDKSSWKVEDIFSIAEKGEYSDLLFQSIGSFAPRGLFNLLIDFELSSNNFLDMKKKTCTFDSPEFEKLMQNTKKYGHIPINTDVTLGQNSGICMVADVDLTTITELFQEYGEEINIVGCPLGEENGHVLSSQGIIAINGRSNNMSAIKYYLKYLLSDEIQYAYNDVSVCKITPPKVQKYMNADGERLTWRGIPLYVLKDGTTSLDEYIRLIEAGHPLHMQNEDVIKQIIEEETAAFFEGNREASEVAHIIQNRVSLWMEENQ